MLVKKHVNIMHIDCYYSTCAIIISKPIINNNGVWKTV